MPGLKKVCPTCQNTYEEGVEYCPLDGMKLRHKRDAQDDPLVGQLLDGRWQIEEKIGEGGMGAVYAASQRSVNRKVAIKTLRAQLNDSEEFVDRFFREAQIATTINDPHCVTILDFGQTEEGVLFLAMEFLEGEDLHERLKRERLNPTEAMKIGVQLASALQAAHDAGVVHRDLKPENIYLLDRSGGDLFVKVLDFGIAKMTNAETQYTRTGQVFGTPQYMSPEQCEGGTLDGRSDLYSVGCILYEVLAGHVPFHDSKSVGLLLAHVSQPPPPLDVRALNIPSGLERIIMRLLAKDADARYPSANALRQALEHELAQLEGTEALRRSGLRTVPVVHAPTLTVEEGATTEDMAPITHAPLSTSSGPPRVAIALGALVVLALLIVGGMALRDRKTPSTPTPNHTTAARAPATSEPPDVRPVTKNVTVAPTVTTAGTTNTEPPEPAATIVGKTEGDAPDGHDKPPSTSKPPEVVRPAATRPARKPVEQPKDRPKPVETPRETPKDKDKDKPKPVEQPVKKPADKPKDKPKDKSQDAVDLLFNN